METNDLSPTGVAAVDLRELKALELAARSKIVFHLGRWLVPSQTTGKTYPVTINPPSCACEDFTLRQLPCKHVIAARLVQERDGGETAPTIDTTEVPKKPSYPQNWSAYNRAQAVEKHRLQALLAELCDTIPEPARTGVGRKPVPITDRLFSICFKVYCGLSTRRTACDLNDAHDRGHLSRPIHHSKVCHFLADPELTPALRELVARSALPLRSVETQFAVDSSGFGTSKFVKWFDEKYGVERSGHDWVKCHVITGCKTNVVTAVEIRDRDAADSPILPGLVRTTAANGFGVKEVSGDKAYLSVENVETIHEVGGTPFIAPKINTTGGAGGLFAKMVGYYQFAREDFLKHYSQRSNVESTFSAVKRKFGDNVRSRNPVAMVNEVLCKFILFNLTRVILSQIELGVEATFWKDEPTAVEGPRDVLPFRVG
jgi:transposase